jgi:hypothetical protein
MEAFEDYYTYPHKCLLYIEWSVSPCARAETNFESGNWFISPVHRIYIVHMTCVCAPATSQYTSDPYDPSTSYAVLQVESKGHHLKFICVLTWAQKLTHHPVLTKCCSTFSKYFKVRWSNIRGGIRKYNLSVFTTVINKHITDRVTQLKYSGLAMVLAVNENYRKTA